MNAPRRFKVKLRERDIWCYVLQPMATDKAAVLYNHLEVLDAFVLDLWTHDLYEIEHVVLKEWLHFGTTSGQIPDPRRRISVSISTDEGFNAQTPVGTSVHVYVNDDTESPNLVYESFGNVAAPSPYKPSDWAKILQANSNPR
ncbi:MAG: hypothetical protein M1827_006597 [Pycnora praestabilis]|nr:MAG: hypothetical protein M1827_006597 [Pycnora praestabilis]